MRLSEMTASQAKDLSLFNLILECYGWEDPTDTEGRLEAGENVKPEGFRIWRQGGLMLQARFHAPVNMISLSMIDSLRREKVQFHFIYDHNPAPILEWLVSVMESFNMDTYAELIKDADGKCEVILLEISESEIYEVKPSAR